MLSLCNFAKFWFPRCFTCFEYYWILFRANFWMIVCNLGQHRKRIQTLEDNAPVDFSYRKEMMSKSIHLKSGRLTSVPLGFFGIPKPPNRRPSGMSNPSTAAARSSLSPHKSLPLLELYHFLFCWPRLRKQKAKWRGYSSRSYGLFVKINSANMETHTMSSNAS